MLWIAGLIAIVLLGTVLMCILIVGGRADRRMELFKQILMVGEKADRRMELFKQIEPSISLPFSAKDKIRVVLKRVFILPIIISILAFVPMANALTITFDTPLGATAGRLPVSASAMFVTGSNSIDKTLTNLQADPTAIIQCISDLSFDARWFLHGQVVLHL